MEIMLAYVVSAVITDIVPLVLVFVHQWEARYHRRLVRELLESRYPERMIVIWGCVVLLVIGGIVQTLLAWPSEGSSILGAGPVLSQQ